MSKSEPGLWRMRLRKTKRQIKNSFIRRPSRFKRWRWYDWVIFACTLCFIAYAASSIIYWGTRLSEYRNWSETLSHPEDIEDDPAKEFLDWLVQNYYKTEGTKLVILSLVTDLYLILSMVLVLIWMRYLRNHGFFIIIVILLLVVVGLFLAIGSIGVQHLNCETITNFAYNYVLEQVESFGVREIIKFERFQAHYNCCGFHSYQDYGTLNQKFHIGEKVKQLFNIHPDSVPMHCCKNYQIIDESKSNPNQCNNIGILLEQENSFKTSKINKQGCGFILCNKILEKKEFLIFLIHGYVLAFLLIIFIIFLFIFFSVILGSCYPLSFRGKNAVQYDNPLEQENLAESIIIPGTPARSYISDSEQTFYAP